MRGGIKADKLHGICVCVLRKIAFHFTRSLKTAGPYDLLQESV